MSYLYAMVVYFLFGEIEQSQPEFFNTYLIIFLILKRFLLKQRIGPPMNVPDPRLRWLRFNEIVMELLHVLVDPPQNFGKEKHVLSIKI